MTNEKARQIGKTVLVVEDNEINREMLKGILEDSYNVLEAGDGEEGLALLREHHDVLSLVLLDVQMPRMNGYDFLQAIADNEALAGVPVIVTTGSTISEDEERCLALGASDFVTKPYNPRIILRRIEAIIRLNESIRTLRAVETDPLTGLYTKSAFRLHAEAMLSGGGAFDMFLLNIEDFSYVNERYGQESGDDLLRHIADSIRALERPGLLVCRDYADRFILAQRHADRDWEAHLSQFDAELHRNAPVRDFLARYAVYENIPADLPVDILCDRLGLAMKTIKHQYDRKVVAYTPEMTEALDRRRRICDCMEQALAEGQFQVYYQPKHHTQTGALAGAEALVRWIHPEYGFLSPAEFIPIFEETGFISKLDLAVWEQVCRDIAAWKKAGLATVPVSVNASRRDFVSGNTLDSIFAPILENGLSPQDLHMEITESLAISDERVVAKVKAIRDRGIRIELDDFGSGHSSLGSIRSIPMDVIKLDISFARDLERQKEVVRMIISLAHALRLKTVAEGVETHDQVEILKDYGCDFLQGYYYSKPIPGADFENYLIRCARKGGRR